MSKIIIVSLRVAQAHATSTGGLAVAVEYMLKNLGQKGVWLGWNGEIKEQRPSALHHEQRQHYEALTFPLTPQQYEEFYCGYANKCLWPAFHHRLDLMSFSNAEYAMHQRVNKQFALYLKSIAEADDLIWIHDYHLLPLGQYCRELGLNNTLGFFLHTPFPSLEITQAIPRHQDWLASLRSYDVLGVQSEPDRQALEQCLKSVSSNLAQLPIVQDFPISVDIQAIQDLATHTEDSPALSPPRATLKTIISADRLDYSKGLTHRLQSVETLLERTPDLREQMQYIQIAPNTRSGIECYQQLRESVETLAGKVNGRFATPDWHPITYINRPVAPPSLMRMFRDSAVGYIAPFKDGMNLVAKEYVAAQDPNDPGVLVLSRFAGAAQELNRGALLVNPFDIENSATQLHRALTMPLAERKERHQQLWAHLKRYDLAFWCQSFLRQLRLGQKKSLSRPHSVFHEHSKILSDL